LKDKKLEPPEANQAINWQYAQENYNNNDNKIVKNIMQARRGRRRD
jgi:hypothetical protein